MFTDDCRELDDAIVEEGRRRLAKSAPYLSPEQVTTWLEDVRRSGGELRLSIDGLVAVYPREASR